ncbi:MAG: enoyl-CoA hydratase/isomerase family protein [Chloroflexi bacterium]|nr:MAG: enoyl-CoA hydratase/isomerase family protein [Chloroflexota bacterium]
MSDEIQLTINNQIATLIVNRPQALNALNWAAQEQFAEAVTAVSQTPTIRVLIITGSGSRAFVAGADLKELSQHPEQAGGERLNRIMTAALTKLTELPIPVIAAINGDAFGGGCEIMTACDLRIAVNYARFSFAQVRNALTSGWGGTARLVRLIGQSRAMELMLTARMMDVLEAFGMGLVHQVVDDGGLKTAVSTLAQQLIQLPHHALAANKALVQFATQHPISETNQRETELFVDLWTQPDHIEAMNAFNEKRKPQFNQ